MKNNEKDLLDLVFEHRNKNYGAYLLRRNYPTSMRNALFLTISGLVAVFAVPYLLAAANRPEMSLERDIIVCPGPPPNLEKKEVPPPPKVELPPVSKPSVRIVPPIVLPNEQVIDEPDLTDLDEPINAEIGKKNIAGDPNSSESPIDEPIDLDELKKVGTAKAAPVEEPLIFVENMPEFPGGYAAFLKYFSEKFVYPPLARETGIQGRVFISFIVEKSGELTNIKAVKGVGGGVEAEAIRVLKSMPHWKPGNQNGNNVRVQMNLPIAVHLE